MITFIFNLYHTIVQALPILIGGAVVAAIVVMLWDVHWGCLRRRNRLHKTIPLRKVYKVYSRG
jgi:hypothetical protein